MDPSEKLEKSSQLRRQRQFKTYRKKQCLFLQSLFLPNNLKQFNIIFLVTPPTNIFYKKADYLGGADGATQRYSWASARSLVELSSLVYPFGGPVEKKEGIVGWVHRGAVELRG
jgi:hypothetical protein